MISLQKRILTTFILSTTLIFSCGEGKKDAEIRKALGREYAWSVHLVNDYRILGDVENAEIYVQVNGQDRQRSHVSKLIWNIAETIEHLSAAWELRPGDLIFTGTPEGVAAVVSGDTLVGAVAGLGEIKVHVS